MGATGAVGAVSAVGAVRVNGRLVLQLLLLTSFGPEQRWMEGWGTTGVVGSAA
jgi:hypothetical protein